MSIPSGIVQQIEALTRQINGLNKAAEVAEKRSLALSVRISALEMFTSSLNAEVKKISEEVIAS